MSDWFITPPIENAVILLVTLPVEDEFRSLDTEADWHPQPNWSSAEQLVLSLIPTGVITPYVFFDPPEAEDIMEERVSKMPEQVREQLAVAAQPFGPLCSRLSGCFRRIFSRNETRRAVAVLAGEASAQHAAVVEALKALRDRTDFVLGITRDSRLILAGCTIHHPNLWEGLSLVESSKEGWSSGIETLLARLRAQGIRHEILPAPMP
jgi:hypothetical protein